MSLIEVSTKSEALQKLISLLGDVLPEQPDKLKLMKFLKARKYDVESAAEMYKKHRRYAVRVEFDSLLKGYVPHQKSHYFATAPLGYDADGALVRLLSVGSSDLKGLSLCHTAIEASRYAGYILETDKLQQKTRFVETGKGGDDVQVYIIDLKELQWSVLFNRTMAQMFVFLLKMYEANYPESLKKAYIVNAPSFFTVIYNFVKTIVPSEILSKVDVIAYEQTGTVLHEIIDPELLPAALGGKLVDTDGNPECNHLFQYPLGTPVPEEFYHSLNLDSDPAAQKATVLNQSTFTVEIPVDVAHTILMWEFQTQDNDIAMCLQLRKNGEDEPKCLIPMRRVNSHRYIESGGYECEETGTYELVFDNTYSWWTSKEVVYKTTISKPGDKVI